MVETRWTRYGKDRVYVTAGDGTKVGYVDLVTGGFEMLAPGYDAVMIDCLQRWLPPAPEVAAVELVSWPAPTIIEPDLAVAAAMPVRDLAANVAGAAVRAKRDEVNAKAPIMNLVARAFGVKTEERAWRVGAKGEQKVAHELAKLGRPWRVLHAVEVGDRGSDIDHVLIGPPGVITINTKRHPDGKAWIGERSIMVNGHRTDYLRNSRYEAARASRLLTAACGRAVNVKPAVVFVDLVDFVVKQMPVDVYVMTKRQLLHSLPLLPQTLSADQIESIYATARLGTTWQPTSA
jgi:hypothetical protein